MWKKLLVNFLLIVGAVNSADNNSGAKIVCYYDSRANAKEGLAKVTLTDLEAGLGQCTHLVYGWTGINDAKKVISLNANQDLDTGSGLFRQTTQLKRKFPGLKILLGIGGDVQGNPEKWLELLESSTSRINFINSAYELVKFYNFDGIDLAFEFPKIKPKKTRSGIGSAWYSFKKAVGAAGKPVDEKSEEHKEEFTALIREIKNSFRPEGFQLIVTINPNVNSTLYLDVPSTSMNIDLLNLAVFDVVTPERNKNEADFFAPIYTPSERNPELNIDHQVKTVLDEGFPASHIILGIPTYGRTWAVEAGKTSTGVPPIEANGPAPEGIQTKTPGLLSYPEICGKILSTANQDLKGENAPLRKVGDPSKKFGTYAYRIPDSSGKFGMWVSFEDPDTAGNKAGFVKTKNLGGVAIHDLTLDDFRGACSGDKFPILRAAKYRLM